MKFATVHTSRTMMFSELEKVMASSLDTGNFLDSLRLNVTGKKSSSGAENTAGYLKRLYRFDNAWPPFAAFKYFWSISGQEEKPLLALLFSIYHDDALAESISVLQNVLPGDKVAIELFEQEIERNHPNQYSANTRRSMAQNLASSWKQAGFIEGKMKNIRTQPEISYKVACFAFLLAYLNGERGDFIWNSIGAKALCLPDHRLRELAVECARKDFMQYQYSGGVTAIGFASLLNKTGINGNTN